MDYLKKLIKKYFSSFAFFYKYLQNKIFIAFFLSVAVSFLDGLGLTMFFPLLQVVGEGGAVNPDEMGQLGIIIKAIESMGISFTLLSVLLVMIVFFVLKGIATYLSQVYIIILQQSFIRKIRINQLNLLNTLSFKHFITSDVGRIQNTMSGEVDRVSRAFISYFRTFQQALMVFVYMGFAFIANTQFAILVSIGGGLTNFLYKIIYERTKGASRKLTTYNSVFQGQIIQHIGHFKYLKATGLVNKYSNKLKETIYDIEKSRKKIGVLASISTAVREPILVVIIAAVIFIQVKFFSGAMGTIIISLLFFYRALASLINMQQLWNTFMEVSGSLENMQDFQNELQQGKEKDGEIIVTSFEDSIIFDHVNFSYGNTPIINNVQLTIPKNKSYALVGESGSGKTTLASLIAGLLPVDNGTIKVDGYPMNTLKKTTYQKRIGFVSQDPVIFNDTIYNNITLWALKTKENLNRFRQSVEQASFDLFINELPEGMETELGHNGINLSGGQKQRVSIARELFKDIDILILDEATSSLDSETEKEIQQNIDELKGQYTIIVIAHRLSTIRNVDQVIFMDKGKIVDMDNFYNLIDRQEKFKRMVELQEI